MERRLDVDSRAAIGVVEVLIGQPAGEDDVRRRQGSQLLDRVVEPLAGEDEPDVGQMRGCLDEWALSLLDQRRAVDPADCESAALLRSLGQRAEWVRREACSFAGGFAAFVAAHW